MLRFSKRTLKVGKKRQVLTALKGAKGWETVEEKLGKLQSTGNSRDKGKNNLSSLALLWMSSSQLGKVILFLHILPKIPVAIRKACLGKFGRAGKGREEESGKLRLGSKRRAQSPSEHGKTHGVMKPPRSYNQD